MLDVNDGCLPCVDVVQAWGMDCQMSQICQVSQLCVSNPRSNVPAAPGLVQGFRAVSLLPWDWKDVYPQMVC